MGKQRKSIFEDPYQQLKKVKIFRNKRTNRIIVIIWWLLFTVFLIYRFIL